LNRKALAVSSMIALGLVTGASAANAGPVTNSVEAGGIKIVEVGTDQMGADTVSGRNREFVTFEITGDTVDLSGVYVEDNWSRFNTNEHDCNRYIVGTLPSQGNALVGKGSKVTVYNGVRFGGNYRQPINGGAYHYHLFADSDPKCGLNGQFYNNNGDTFWIRKPGGWEASFTYEWNGGYTITNK
jgi:hypothetical protein